MLRGDFSRSTFCLNILLREDVDDPAGCEAQGGDDGQSHEREGHKRINFPVDSQTVSRFLGRLQLFIDVHQRVAAHDTGNLQRQIPQDMLPGYHRPE